MIDLNFSVHGLTVLRIQIYVHRRSCYQFLSRICAKAVHL